MSDIAANVLIVAHHGSMSSSRKAFLDAVASSVAAVSSGPHEYSGHKLPDNEVVTELEAHGQVCRTDLDDDACKTNPKQKSRTRQR